MEYVEITKEVFDKVVLNDTTCFKVEHFEHCHKAYYNVLGCEFLQILNFTSGVTQYYIKDINV